MFSRSTVPRSPDISATIVTKSVPLSTLTSDITRELINSREILKCVLPAEYLDSEIEQHMVRTEAGWQCLTCSWQTKYKARCWEHVEAVHVPSSGYSCQYCAKFCSTKNALKIHKTRYHRNLTWISNKIFFHWFRIFVFSQWFFRVNRNQGNPYHYNPTLNC